MCAFALVGAGSAAAVSITFDGEVLRYREAPRERVNFVSIRLITSAAPPYLRTYLVPDSIAEPIESVHVDSGCQKAGLRSGDPRPPAVRVRCPLASARSAKPRYRLTLSGYDHRVLFRGPRLRGVVYARGGQDTVASDDRIYGGAGSDELYGALVYGGAGGDDLYGPADKPDPGVLYGGTGEDYLDAPGWLYGGPGPDELSDSFPGAGYASRDMLVGGPGRDTVWLTKDRHKDVVRVRGGGVDRVRCAAEPDRGDVLFVDLFDRVESKCRTATVLYTERPRYPYP